VTNNYTAEHHAEQQHKLQQSLAVYLLDLSAVPPTTKCHIKYNNPSIAIRMFN